MRFAPTRAWLAGWIAGVAVVAVAAGLLLTIIALARRVAGQARDIEAAIDGARQHTQALYELTKTNASLAHTTERLRAVRES